MARLGQNLSAESGRGFEAKNLHRRVQRQLSWSRVANLLPLKAVAARHFYARGITVAEYWAELPPKAELARRGQLQRAEMQQRNR